MAPMLKADALQKKGTIFTDWFDLVYSPDLWLLISCFHSTKINLGTQVPKDAVFLGLMPSQLNDPTVHFFWHLLAYHISDHQTKPDCCSELHISLTSQNCTLHRLARKFSSLWYAFPLPSMAPPYIVDCLHIWPLPRGRIYLGWHQCILAVRSFWFDMKKKCKVFLNFCLIWYVQVYARHKHLKIS